MKPEDNFDRSLTRLSPFTAPALTPASLAAFCKWDKISFISASAELAGSVGRFMLISPLQMLCKLFKNSPFVIPESLT